MSGVRGLALLMAILLLIEMAPAAARDKAELEDAVPQTLEAALERIEQLEQRLRRLEPASPVRIEDPPGRRRFPFPTHFVPAADLMNPDSSIDYKVTSEDPSYARPAYDPLWHSSGGRWSYMPSRVHTALHRMFASYDLALSEWYDFWNNIGIDAPVGQDPTSVQLHIVVFQADIQAVYSRGNQIVISAVPTRMGVQTIALETQHLSPEDPEESLLLQLVTASGDELDYTLTYYAPPDARDRAKRRP